MFCSDCEPVVVCAWCLRSSLSLLEVLLHWSQTLVELLPLSRCSHGIEHYKGHNTEHQCKQEQEQVTAS